MAEEWTTEWLFQPLPALEGLEIVEMLEFMFGIVDDDETYRGRNLKFLLRCIWCIARLAFERREFKDATQHLLEMLGEEPDQDPIPDPESEEYFE